MFDLSAEAIGLVAIALIFGFYNGIHDSSNIVATMIATRAMQPRAALVVAAIANGIGPFLFGVAVAKTIGGDIVEKEAVTLPVTYAALISAIALSAGALKFGLPTSSSHALIGGLIGAVWAGFGLEAIHRSGMVKVLLTLFLSPILGLVTGYFFNQFSRFLAKGATPRVNRWFRRGQIFSGATLGLAHGTNDAQKTMGIIVLGLVATGYQQDATQVPTWVILISALAIAIGTMMGGWSLIRTLGGKFYRVRPIHGFSAQSASTFVILGAALIGGPASTTHVNSSAIIGAGAADRAQMVRWGVLYNILASWLLTIPITAGLGAILYMIISAF